MPTDRSLFDKGSPQTPSGVSSRSRPQSDATIRHDACEVHGDASQQSVSLDASNTLMQLAAALEAQETKIKHALLEAANAGDTDLVSKILDLWLNGPVADVLHHLEQNDS